MRLRRRERGSLGGCWRRGRRWGLQRIVSRKVSKQQQQQQINKLTNKQHIFPGMKFYQNLDKKTIKLLETVKSVYPTPQMQQPIRSSETLLPSDTSYKPISPFTSPPGDTARPPVPSRRLKPPNETEELIFPGEDDTELALINWAASKQGNREVSKCPVANVSSG